MMKGKKLEEQADLYMYPGRDDELLNFYYREGRFTKKNVLIGLADYALKNGLGKLKNDDEKLTSFKNNKNGKAEEVRLKLRRHKTPELADFWEILPNGGKSEIFVEMIKASLSSFDGVVPFELYAGTGNIKKRQTYSNIKEIEMSGSVSENQTNEMDAGDHIENEENTEVMDIKNSLLDSLRTTSILPMDFDED